MKAIVTVLGLDQKGIIAKVSTCLYSLDINILNISQTIMEDKFTMIMIVDMSDNGDISAVSKSLDALAKEIKVEIRIQSEDIFYSMHQI